MIRKTKGGKYNVVHCHGEDKGKPINKKLMTKKEAIAMHQAIEASKHRRGK
jgi:hypothetical protein